MRHLEHVAAGEEVVMTDVNRPTRRVKVERVGRTNIYVDGTDSAFDRKTGKVKDRYGHRYLKTIDEWEHQKRVLAMRGELRRFGVEVRIHVDDAVVLTIHAALKPIMDAAKPTA